MLTKFRIFLRGSTIRNLTSYEIDLISMQTSLPSKVKENGEKYNQVNKENLVAEALSSPMKINDKDEKLMEDLHNDPIFRAYFFI